ncbi:hypothetical protein HFP15_29785 [Amycolatopsis sp. K13G38]|uniref:DUF7064 domain-containing protein n=1 Tax=Amycolatopsis acididurans TaxID=2724524 RepID=A0ABX1JDX5_9PSEU|nr:hypothetical protein [Amycolatopsis acididurans]NKQ57069.1 hypothetical protein [Amycolatopsis acididurans]
MLSDLDETLFHQFPQPFAVVATSDHRFFDRYWFCGADPRSGLAFFAGFGRYPNMATRDGFLCVLDGHTQHNVRVATQREAATGFLAGSAGPLTVEVHAPYRRIALSLDTPRLRARLEFRTDRPPHLERHHVELGDARILQDQQRYVQVGSWDGWIELGAGRHRVEDWWGDRDHAWGVRVDVGGLEPPEMSRRTRSFTVWCSFTAGARHGMFQLREYADGRPRYVDGALYHDGAVARVRDIEYDVSFAPGTRVYRRARLWVHLESGDTAEIIAEPLTARAWAGRGGGYSRGFDDGRGFGARRGEVVEYDCYDLTDPAEVRSGGAVVPAGHREQLARLTVDGEPGIGHLPIMDRSGLLPG